MENLTAQDISVLKYYKEGRELCGFEGVHSNLYKLGLLDGDLELTSEGRKFIKEFKDWDSIISFDNKMYVSIKL
jgi:hypothetical protein